MANQPHRDTQALSASRHITSANKNVHHSTDASMLVPGAHTPPTTTDQYQHTESIWRIVTDVISLIILTVITVISHFIAKPFTRGFFCSDTTIKYPYKDNTIPTYAAVILSIALPIVWMWTTEFCKRFYYAKYPKETSITRLELCGKKIANINPFVRNLYILTVIFAYGYLSTWVLLEIAKNFVGELRPHFLALCQPSFDCSTVTSLNQFNSYLQFGSNYTCLNTDDTAVREGRWFWFLIMYIHVSWSWRYLGIVGHIFQTGLAILGSYIGYTRISDFHHHWNDVLVGGIVGSLIAFVSFRFILNWRHYNPRFLPYTINTIRPKPSSSPNNDHHHHQHHYF